MRVMGPLWRVKEPDQLMELQLAPVATGPVPFRSSEHAIRAAGNPNHYAHVRSRRLPVIGCTAHGHWNRPSERLRPRR